MKSPGFSRVLALLSLCAVPSLSRAEQFVLFDVTFTYTKADADNSRPSKSHYYVKDGKLNPDRPRDWTAPVDYRNGTVHIRAEIIEKAPGGAPTTWTICYIPNKGRGNGYGCTGTDIYREAGVYEKDVSMTKFWENDSIIWSEGIKQMDLVIKDDSGGQGHAHKRKDPERYFPTKVRITVVQVSAGSKYDPSLVPDLPRTSGKGATPKSSAAVAGGGRDEKAEGCAACGRCDEGPGAGAASTARDDRSSQVRAKPVDLTDIPRRFARPSTDPPECADVLHRRDFPAP